MRILKWGDRGNDVMQIQALLKKIGYDPGTIDGVYGNQTKEAVASFQRINGLIQDGIVGADTYRYFERLLLGYDTYSIKKGDTIVSIAKKYYTTPNAIFTANPTVNSKNLIIGQKIIVPYGIPVVDTNINYTYEVLDKDIKGLKVRYPFIEVGVAGQSVLGKNLYYIKLGRGTNKVFYNGAHHALEWITSPLLMKFAENFSNAYANGTNIREYNAGDLWNKSTIYIMPMVNPDGVNLVLNGLQKENPFYTQLLQWNNGKNNFGQVWEANIRGVDLNHNYDASWYLSKAAEAQYGVFGPGPTRYSGPYPESEPESKAVADFTRNHNFRLVIAYHSQGEVIYWTYGNIIPPDSRKIAEAFSAVSGYALSQPYGIVSYAGYKDWFIDKFTKPGFTIEVGRGKNPLPISQFDKIYRDNEGILLLGATI